MEVTLTIVMLQCHLQSAGELGRQRRRISVNCLCGDTIIYYNESLFCIIIVLWRENNESVSKVTHCVYSTHLELPWDTCHLSHKHLSHRLLFSLVHHCGRCECNKWCSPSISTHSFSCCICVAQRTVQLASEVQVSVCVFVVTCVTTCVSTSHGVSTHIASIFNLSANLIAIPVVKCDPKNSVCPEKSDCLLLNEVYQCRCHDDKKLIDGKCTGECRRNHCQQ